MNAPIFLLRKNFKNWLKEITHKPGKLILYLLVIAFIVFMVLMQLLPGFDAEAGHSDMRWLTGGLFGYFLLLFVPSLLQGLKQGSTLFGMEDVNFLFVSPVKPRSILFYGFIRTMKTYVFIGVFVLFMSAMLYQQFGITIGKILFLYVGYALFMIIAQILSLVVYIVSHGNPRRQLVIKILAVLVFVPLVVGFIYQLVIANESIIDALFALLGSPVTAYTPLLGWASAALVDIISANVIAAIPLLLLLAAFLAALVIFICVYDADFYEDVLVATETAFERKRDLADGKFNMATASNRSVKVKESGVRGSGASALYHKHLREAFRGNRFGLWGTASLAYVIGTVVYTALMKQTMGTDTGDLPFITAFAFFTFMQILLASTGAGQKELYCHYIYLIPEDPLIKVLWNDLEILPKSAVEGVVVFVLAGIICGVAPSMMIAATVAYVLFSFLMTGMSYTSLRFTGADMSAGVLIMLFIVAVLIVMLPGIVGAIVVAVVAGSNAAGLFVLAAWELLAGFVLFYAAKGILHNCDMPAMKQTQK